MCQRQRQKGYQIFGQVISRARVLGSGHIPNFSGSNPRATLQLVGIWVYVIILRPEKGVSNGPIQFRSVRKIWPSLELLTKIIRVLAGSCSKIFAIALTLVFSLICVRLLNFLESLGYD